MAGYGGFMDGSVHDWQRKTSQFTPGKNFDASGAMGPWLITADEVPDPQALQLRTVLDGEVVQRGGDRADDLLRGRADLLLFDVHHARAGRRDRHGHPGRRGGRPQAAAVVRVGSVVAVDISGVGRLRNGVVEG